MTLASPLSQSGGRLQFLDALRGMAAVAVLLFHYSARWGFGPASWTRFWNVGAFGVYTFFLVSGFVIPMSLQRYSLPQFWRSRIFRLLPAYLFVCALLLLLQYSRALPADPAFQQLHLRTVLSNVLMIGLFTHAPMVVQVSWTLALELVFYVLCSGLKAAGLLSHRLITAVVALALYSAAYLLTLAGVVPTAAFKGEWGAMLLAAFLGSVFYEVQAGKRSAFALRWLIPVFLIVVICAMRFSTQPGGSDAVFRTAMPAATAWIAALALFAGLFAFRSRSFPRWMVWLGRISFSLYLFHEVVGRIFMAWIRPGVLANTLEIGIAMAAAHLSYLLIERPFLHLARGSHRNAPASPEVPVVA